MSPITIVAIIFSVLGALDYILGNKFGIGKDFEKGFMLLGKMALSMIGMICFAPLLAQWLAPVFDGVYNIFGIDPSLIPASLFANDMGGEPLANQIAKDVEIGKYNAFIVSAMMGVTISFTIPVALQMVKKEYTRQLALGLLCGVVTIPIGCFVSGLMLNINILALLFNLLPLVILAAILAVGLWFVPNVCVVIFKVIGFIMNALIITGLMLGGISFLMGKPLIEELGSVEEGAVVCINAAIVLSGMIPLFSIISRILKKPLAKLGEKLGMNNVSMVGLISNVVTNMTTIEMMNDMDKKGAMINSAFAVSASFALGGHMAYTMARDEKYVVPMIVGKLVAGVFAVALAFILYRKFNRSEKDNG